MIIMAITMIITMIMMMIIMMMMMIMTVTAMYGGNAVRAHNAGGCST